MLTWYTFSDYHWHRFQSERVRPLIAGGAFWDDPGTTGLFVNDNKRNATTDYECDGSRLSKN